MALTLHPLGILLALIFVSCMTFLFLWMFRVPPARPLPVVMAVRSVTRIHRILVPVVETTASERAVELACRLGRDQKAEVVLAFVKVVPMSLPLEAPMANVEAAGRQALETAKFIVNQHNLAAKTRILPHRTAADGILRIAREENVDAIILGVDEHQHAIPGPMGRTVTDVMRKASCEVILDKVPTLAAR